MNKIGIVGLGYVGLPLGLQFARRGVHVLGLDVDNTKVDAINSKISYFINKLLIGWVRNLHLKRVQN